ncbi:MAG TPA: C40 family peptidase [Pseudonocardiaceae bacterium]|jgi:cell wall-associated NlpC family hydrolase
MTTSPLVDLFGDPIRSRLRQLTDRADLVDRTRTELRSAATTVADQRHQLMTRTTTVTEHWHGSAADKFGHQASAAKNSLTTLTEALSTADVLVAGALGAVRTGHATVQRLLDEYTTVGNQTVGAAMKLLDAGHPTAMIDVAGFLSTLSDKYVAEADTAVHTARQELTTATQDFAALMKLLPEPEQPQHKTAHAPAKHQIATQHNGGTTAPSSATQVHIGHGLGTVTAPNAKAATAVRTALSQLGVPYVWGGESPGHAFDCSGLTAYAYSKAGITLPHFASSQRIGKKVSEQDLKPGDLVIFSGHVTMYIGKGQVVAAPHTGTDVQIEPLFTSIPGDPFLGFYRPSVRG